MQKRRFTQIIQIQSYESIVTTSLCLYEKKIPKDIHKLIYKFIQLQETNGRYYGMRPKQASNKVFLNLIRKSTSKYNYESIVIMSLYLFRNNVTYNIQKMIFKYITSKQTTIIFKIREVTRGSKHKTFVYKGQRVELDKPVSINIKGDNNKQKTITYKYSNTVTKYKLPKK